MAPESNGGGCPLTLPECPRSIARPPALRMSDERAAAEIAGLAHDLRQGRNPIAVADKLSTLVDRLRGLNPMPRKGRNAIVLMTTRAGSKRVQVFKVQSVRGQFGL
jgi:hypothetical protein